MTNRERLEEEARWRATPLIEALNALFVLLAERGAEWVTIEHPVEGAESLTARVRSNCEWAETPRRLLEDVHGGARRRDRQGQPLLAWREVGNEFHAWSAKQHHDGSVSAWEAEFDATAMTSGRADYKTVATAPSGLTFEFPIPLAELSREGGPEAAVRIAARYAPVDVRWNGKRILEGDFLEGAVYRQGWRKAEIGVFQETSLAGNGNPLDLLQPARQGRRGRMVVGGILLTAEELPEMERRGERWWTRVTAPADTWLRWHTGSRNRIDTDCPYWTELRRAAQQAIYMAMAQSGSAIEVSRKSWEEAKLTGIELPNSSEALVPWEAEGHADASGNGRDGRELLSPAKENFIMVADGTARQDLHVLADAAAPGGMRLWRPDPELAGYDWYDRLERLTEVHVSAESEDSSIEVTDARNAGEGIATREVRKVWALVTLQRQDGTERKVHVATDIAYGYAQASDARAIGIVYTPEIKDRPVEETAGRIAAAAIETTADGAVRPNDGGRALRESAEWVAVAIHGAEPDETKDLIRRRMGEQIREVLGEGGEVRIRRLDDGGLTIDVSEHPEPEPVAGL